MQRDWTITALESDLPRALAMCHGNFERGNVIALHGLEIKRMARDLAAQGKLGKRERAIAEKYGYRDL